MKEAADTAENATEDTEKKAEESETEKLKKELAEANDKYLRLMAEYDNFRKRSAKERLELTDTAKGNVINGFLPVFDNFERALGTETQDAVYKQGVEMIFNQFSDALKKLNVESWSLRARNLTRTLQRRSAQLTTLTSVKILWRRCFKTATP